MQNKILKHPSIIHAADIAGICQPLQKLNISYFAHVRINNKGRFSTNCGSPEFTKHYIENNYYNADIHMANENSLGNYILWDTIERTGKSEKMHCEAAAFGIQHTFTIVKKAEHGIDYYHFANGSNSKLINQTYLSNLELLNKFIQYFNENIRTNKSLLSAYDITFDIDYHHGEYSIQDKNEVITPEANRQAFINMLNLDMNQYKENTLLHSLKNCCNDISNREAQVLLLLIKGKSAKAISCDLNLSCRTIEHYIVNLKNKTGAFSKMDLIGKFINHVLVA